MKRLPIVFRGELHDVRLVQFSLDPREAQSHLPCAFRPYTVNGRALVSLVDVRLKRMRPAFASALPGFRYRHIAFRFLIDDAEFAQSPDGHGIFFVRSFTDRPLIAFSAGLLTEYRLTVACIRDTSNGVEIRQGDREICYALSDSAPRLYGTAFDDWKQAAGIVGVIDRAYAIRRSGEIVMTRIIRPEWPIRPLDISHFATDFFDTAQLECGFAVERPVPYLWQAPRAIAVR